MEWHYASQGKSEGPVSSSDLKELRHSGEIEAETLVWTESLDGWRPYEECLTLLDQSLTSDSTASDEHPPSLTDSDTPLAVCAWSGRTLPESEMLKYGDEWIAPEFKDRFVQRLQEGGIEADGEIAVSPDELAPDLNFLSIITQTARIWWANLLSISVVTVVIWLPLNLVLEYIAYQQLETEESLEDIIGGVRDAIRYDRIAEFWIGVIVTGGILWLARQSWTGAPKPGIGAVFSAGFRNWGRLVGTRIVFGLFLVLIVLPGLIPIFVGETFFLTIGVTYICIALLIYYTRHGFAEMAAISDDKGGPPALDQSRRVTKGHFWRIVGYQVLVFGVLVLVGLLVGLLGLIPVFDNFVVSAVLSTVINLAMSFGIIEMFVFYRHLEFDARDR